jgi:hypothetical protein
MTVSLSRSRPAFPPGTRFPSLPHVIVHADWGTKPKKRWAVRATLDAGSYDLSAPFLIPSASDLLSDAVAAAKDGRTTLLGFDFAMGIPIAYAKRSGAKSFLDLIARADADFFAPVASLELVTQERPFLATMAKGNTENALRMRLGLDASTQLRRCETSPGTYRGDACCIFIPKPAKQVAGATRTGWSEVLQSALRSPARAEGVIRVWPFDGALADLVQPGNVCVAETYPGELYAHLAMVGNSKTVQTWRQAHAAHLLAAARETATKLHPLLAAQIASGFGDRSEGEDPFDATVGVLGMIRIVLGLGCCDAPTDDDVSRYEGWIVGRPCAGVA